MSRNASNNENGEFDEIYPKTRLERMSSREGYQQSVDFDESGEFGENDVIACISGHKWAYRQTVSFFCR